MIQCVLCGTSGELRVIGVSVSQFSRLGLVFTDVNALVVYCYFHEILIDKLVSSPKQVPSPDFACRMISRGRGEIGADANQ